jgi:hypothetical protein
VLCWVLEVVVIGRHQWPIALLKADMLGTITNKKKLSKEILKQTLLHLSDNYGSKKNRFPYARKCSHKISTTLSDSTRHILICAIKI